MTYETADPGGTLSGVFLFSKSVGPLSGSLLPKEDSTPEALKSIDNSLPIKAIKDKVRLLDSQIKALPNIPDEQRTQLRTIVCVIVREAAVSIHNFGSGFGAVPSMAKGCTGSAVGLIDTLIECFSDLPEWGARLRSERGQLSSMLFQADLASQRTSTARTVNTSRSVSSQTGKKNQWNNIAAICFVLQVIVSLISVLAVGGIYLKAALLSNSVYYIYFILIAIGLYKSKKSLAAGASGVYAVSSLLSVVGYLGASSHFYISASRMCLAAAYMMLFVTLCTKKNNGKKTGIVSGVCRILSLVFMIAYSGVPSGMTMIMALLFIAGAITAGMNSNS